LRASRRAQALRCHGPVQISTISTLWLPDWWPCIRNMPITGAASE
jgi:hypothetical protein